jgi:hypothetical protein
MRLNVALTASSSPARSSSGVIWRSVFTPTGQEFAVKVVPMGDDFSDIVKEVTRKRAALTRCADRFDRTFLTVSVCVCCWLADQVHEAMQ